MAKCSYHPNVDTEMTCAECGKPICPKEMVLTPVGYKCPEDARPKREQYTFVKPKQMLFAALGAGGLGIAGALAVWFTGFGGFLGGLVWGAATAEVARRASGGHRGGIVGAIAAAGIVLGWLALLVLGGIDFVTPVIAIVVALIQLGAFGGR